MDLKQAARDAAIRNGVPVDLYLGLVQQESGFRSDAVSSAGAMGPAQLMPATARGLGVDPRDPIQNLEGGARYLKQQLDRFGDPKLALAAYNAGPGAVSQYGGIPPYRETQEYVAKVQQNARNFGGNSGMGEPSASGAKGGDWMSGLLAPIETAPVAAPSGSSRQMPALIAPLAAAALAFPQLRTGAPLAGHRLQAMAPGADSNALTTAAQALVSGGPLSAIKPQPVSQPSAPAQKKSGQDLFSTLFEPAGNELSMNSATAERVDMSPRNISSIVPDRNQPGFDLYFEDKRFPALMDGVVVETGRQGNQQAGYGNFAVIRSTDAKTGEPVDVLYGHLADDSIRVKEGDRVYAGQQIGTQGGTGSVRSVDGTIASVDFLHPAPKGSGSMTPYRHYRRLVDDFSRQFRIAN